MGTSSGSSLSVYLLQLLGNTHACVHPLPALRVFGFIVFQEVTSGEFRTNEARQRRIWNNNGGNGVITEPLSAASEAADTTRFKYYGRYTAVKKDESSLSDKNYSFIPGNMKNTLQKQNMVTKDDCDYEIY